MADEKTESKSRSEGSLEVRVPDASDTKAQDRALQEYKITGRVGDYVDPTRDQEWDIAPEFGVAPHPELHNVSPDPDRAGFVGFGQPAPTRGHPLSSVVASKVLPVDEKVKIMDEQAKAAGDQSVAERLEAGRPDFRGDVNASPPGAPQPVVVVGDTTKSEDK